MQDISEDELDEVEEDDLTHDALGSSSASFKAEQMITQAHSALYTDISQSLLFTTNDKVFKSVIEVHYERFK